MNVSSQFIFGLLIGFMLSMLFFFSFAAYSQIGVLQNQVSDLQSQFNQIKTSIVQPTIQNITSTRSPPTTATPSSSVGENLSVSELVEFEDLEFTSVYSNKTGDYSYVVHLQFKNTGNVSLTLNVAKVVINGHLAQVANTGAEVTWGNVGPGISSETLQPSQSDIGTIIELTSSANDKTILYHSGLPLEIVLQSESNMHYTTELILP
jgi:hypothetical protein